MIDNSKELPEEDEKEQLKQITVTDDEIILYYPDHRESGLLSEE